jgi:hypothetical protein
MLNGNSICPECLAQVIKGEKSPKLKESHSFKDLLPLPPWKGLPIPGGVLQLMGFSGA